MSKPKQNPPIDVPPEVIRELLTESELRMVKQRLLIMKLLKGGLTIRAIAEKAKVGTDTVIRMARKLEKSPVLKNTFRELSDSAMSSKWVFGRKGSKE